MGATPICTNLRQIVKSLAREKHPPVATGTLFSVKRAGITVYSLPSLAKRVVPQDRVF
jgi:hypothetical protein